MCKVSALEGNCILYFLPPLGLTLMVTTLELDKITNVFVLFFLAWNRPLYCWKNEVGKGIEWLAGAVAKILKAPLGVIGKNCPGRCLVMWWGSQVGKRNFVKCHTPCLEQNGTTFSSQSSFDTFSCLKSGWLFREYGILIELIEQYKWAQAITWYFTVSKLYLCTYFLNVI